MAELAARGNPDVTSASGRLGDDELNVGIAARRAEFSRRDAPRRTPARLAQTLSDTTYPVFRST